MHCGKLSNLLVCVQVNLYLHLQYQGAVLRLVVNNHPLNNANFGFWQATKVVGFYLRWRVLHPEFTGGSFGFVDGREGAGRYPYRKLRGCAFCV